MVLVDHTEGGFAAELVAFLAPYLNGAPASDDLVTTGPAAELAKSVATLVVEGKQSAPVVKALVEALCAHTGSLPKADMLPAYTLMWDVINAYTPADQPQVALELVKQLAAAITKDAQDRPATRLSVMGMLYDRCCEANPEWRFDLLPLYVHFVHASKQPQGLPSPQEVTGWLSYWDRNAADRLRVLDACYAAAAELCADVQAQAWLDTLLLECDSADTAVVKAHAEQAKTAIASAIRSPTVYQFDHLLERAAVQQLGKEDAAVKALHVFISGKPEDLAGHTAALQAMGVDIDQAAAKMRHLALVDAAHAAPDGTLAFADVAAATGVAVEDVEELVLSAISLGIMEARMDELSRTVRVQRCMHRTFGAREWKALHAQLGKWRESVQGLLEVIGTAPVASS
mmetsp:Transcript_19122/g.51441  ORF Transcript_19122/g.51441 Transcript_19122/m.51441 type:complete len:400 (-) Transcript_19122:596-1795(-)